jgi:hypothetical protein
MKETNFQFYAMSVRTFVIPLFHIVIRNEFQIRVHKAKSYGSV